MEPIQKLTRREISVQAALFLLGGATITISGCGGGSSPGGATDRSASISGNHGHAATITAAQQTAGGGLSLSIQGSATHNHTVDLSADDVVAIRNGTQVTRATSTTLGHTHNVTFN